MFKDYLLSSEVGFSSYETIDPPNHNSKGRFPQSFERISIRLHTVCYTQYYYTTLVTVAKRLIPSRFANPFAPSSNPPGFQRPIYIFQK